MWPGERLLLEWRQRAPRWTALAIAALIVVDVAHSAWLLRPSAAVNHAFDTNAFPGTAEHTDRPYVAHRPDTQQIVSAHLFGTVSRHLVTGDALNAPDTQLQLALSGIIAGKSPEDGFAILGPQGKPTQLYRAGAAIADTAGGHLYRVFADRVVLDFDGRLEILRLPHQGLPGLAPARPPDATGELADATTSAAPAADSDDPNHPTPAEGLFNYMAAEQNNVDGHMAGVVLHPAKLIQRRYGLHDGDTVTAVNGVQITDPGVLADTLKTSGKSLSLTYTHDGVQQTKIVQLND